MRSIALASLALVAFTFPALAQGTAEGADQLWSFLEASLPAWAVMTLLVLRQLAEIAGKFIPDDQTGFWGIVRKASKVLAGYVSNQKTPADE